MVAQVQRGGIARGHHRVRPLCRQHTAGDDRRGARAGHARAIGRRKLGAIGALQGIPQIRLPHCTAGQVPPREPTSGEVIGVLRRHAELLVQMRGDERTGCRDIRKHMAWYLKGFSVRQQVRQSLGTVATLAELDELLAQIDADQEFNLEVGQGPRGRTSAP